MVSFGLPPEEWFPRNRLSGRVEDEGLPRKQHKPDEIAAKLRQVDMLVSQGRAVAEAVRRIGVTAFTCYRRRREFGG